MFFHKEAKPLKDTPFARILRHIKMMILGIRDVYFRSTSWVLQTWGQRSLTWIRTNRNIF